MNFKYFNTKFLYKGWNKSLKDKNFFFEDDIEKLVNKIENEKIEMTAEVLKKHGFSISAIHKFYYYDPNYEVKVAYFNKKHIQYRRKVDRKLADECFVGWFDIEFDEDVCVDFDGSIEKYEYRIKPNHGVYVNTKGKFILIDNNHDVISNDWHKEFIGTQEECEKYIKEHTFFVCANTGDGKYHISQDENELNIMFSGTYNACEEYIKKYTVHDNHYYCHFDSNNVPYFDKNTNVYVEFEGSEESCIDWVNHKKEEQEEKIKNEKFNFEFTREEIQILCGVLGASTIDHDKTHDLFVKILNEYKLQEEPKINGFKTMSLNEVTFNNIQEIKCNKCKFENSCIKRRNNQVYNKELENCDMFVLDDNYIGNIIVSDDPEVMK